MVGSIPCVEGVAPSDAVASGEEYELLVTARESATPDVEAFARKFGLPLTEIGRVVVLTQEPVQVVGGAPGGHGYDHLRSRRSS
jgi:Thiamine monophosphate kinase